MDAESHATQTPADLTALLTLAVFAATIARRVEVEARPGWREPVNLFVSVLLEPGNRKSAVFNDVMRPLREWESELIQAARPAVAREQSDRRQVEARLKKLEKQAVEKDDVVAKEEASRLAAELAGRHDSSLPRLIVDDATTEKLGMMLAEQGGRIASLSPEGGVFDLMAGQYSKTGMPQMGVYLMGHSGDDLITDRVSRPSLVVKRPALTCAYAIQPAVIAGLAENSAFRGRGLLARFLYAAPESWIGQRKVAPTPVPASTREAYRQLVRRLSRTEGDHTLGLASDAATLLLDWETEIEVMLGDGGQMELMRDWGAKLAGATLRLAGVLHCTEHDTDQPIGRGTLAAAIEIARYLAPHADCVLNLMAAKDSPGAGDTLYIVKWFERHKRREFTKSEAQHHGKRRFPKANDIDKPLAELTQRGYIRLRAAEPAGAGRPASPTFEVNPLVFAQEDLGTRSLNSHYSASVPDGGNSRNIGNAFDAPEPGQLFSTEYRGLPD